eukprot:gene25655-biopygen24003
MSRFLSSRAKKNDLLRKKQPWFRFCPRGQKTAQCRMCDFLSYTAPPPPFPPTGRQEGRRGCPETVVGKLDHPPVPPAPPPPTGQARQGAPPHLRCGSRAPIIFMFGPTSPTWIPAGGKCRVSHLSDVA